MSMPDLETQCWEHFNMSPNDFLDRYSKMSNNEDRLIHEGEICETRQFKDTPYFYLIVETARLPGIRLSSIWDSREE